MRKEFLIMSLMLGGAAALLCSPASAQYSQHRPDVQVDVGIFYDDLSPYGDWVEMPDYGWSFAPRVDRDWRPYTRGQWVWTDYGWYWDSDEDFGWAAYHYGRWVNDRYYGWVWVPGVEWAPAWVSWRHGNGYIGWAPLPPRVSWQTRIGFNIGGLEIDAYIGARDYAFVSDRSFVDRGVYQRVLPPTQNITILNVTNNVTNYTTVNNQIVNRGIAVDEVARVSGRAVPRVRTVDADQANAPRRAESDEVAVFRPRVQSAPERRPAKGRSLVKGEAPSPLMVERRRMREQAAAEPEPSAKDVAQRRPAGIKSDQKPTGAERPQAERPAAAPQPAEPRQEADRARANAQKQQRQERDQAQAQAEAQQQRERQQADKRQKDAEPKARPQATRPPVEPSQPRPEERARPQEAQQERDRQQAEQQRADRQRAKEQEQAQADRRAKDAPAPAKAEPKGKDKKEPKPKPSPNPA